MNYARLDWDDLRLFLGIARAGTLTAAASRLRLSQPTAGRRLRTLEEVCGCALFQRTPGGFRLTDEGEAMLRHAERMEEEALALQRQFAGNDGELQGQLRISSSDWFANVVLAPAAAAFCVHHPQVTIEIVADFRLLSLDRREADLVFRFLPFDAPDVVQRRFTHIRYDLFASSDYLHQRGAPEPASDGEGHALIGMDSQFDTLADVAWLRRRFPQARFAIRSNSREVQATACARGTGLAALPSLLGRQLGLIPLEADEPPPGRDIWLGYHADLKRLRRLRALVDHLSATVSDPL
ncbi:LysR family transcriptional regulator [Sphingomonas quercus]|uniref:LysR family transcriptional regulator n=1 Tax=Sphingomonas quercus TaxID=2842451 RepID=A0ABS6BIE5_9SPHN|nr:LysR family transcriptional regulator [Sphingomonas quercus]MBU3078080.1 LysR family transcriptional regulator [Sphingomonas quercus]